MIDQTVSDEFSQDPYRAPVFNFNTNTSSDSVLNNGSSKEEIHGKIYGKLKVSKGMINLQPLKMYKPDRGNAANLDKRKKYTNGDESPQINKYLHNYYQN